jgi:hypothetical protein
MGRRLATDWDGTERRGPTAAEEAAELAAVLDLDDRELARNDAAWRRSIRATARRQSPTPSPAPTEIACEECGDPATRVIAQRHYCAAHGEPLAIPAMVLEAIARRHASKAASAKNVRASRRDWTRARLAVEIQARQEPGRAARLRWERMHGLLRAKVLAGEIAAELRLPDGETVYPSLKELRVAFRGRARTTASAWLASATFRPGCCCLPPISTASSGPRRLQ